MSDWGLKGGRAQPRGLPHILLHHEARGLRHDVSFGVNVLGLTPAPTGKEKGGEVMGHAEKDINKGLVILEDHVPPRHLDHSPRALL